MTEENETVSEIASSFRKPSLTPSSHPGLPYSNPDLSELSLSGNGPLFFHWTRSSEETVWGCYSHQCVSPSAVWALGEFAESLEGCELQKGRAQ